MDSCCFICGVHIVASTRSRGGKFENDLGQLIRRLGKLLKLTNQSDNTDNWDDFTNLQQQSICCGKCYSILKNVERDHEIILATEKQLNTYLDKVQALIVESDKLGDIQTSLWNPTCFELRWSILERVTASNDDGAEEDLTLKIKVKSEVLSDYDKVNLVEGLLDDDSTQDDDNWNNNESPTIDVHTNTNEELASSVNVNSTTRYKSEQSSKIKVSTHSTKKRKIQVICEEDEETKILGSATLEPSPKTSSTTKRAAKKNAEKVIKQYMPDSEEAYESKEDADFADSFSATGVSESDDTDSENSNSCTYERLGKLEGEGSDMKSSNGSIFYPFLLAEENLFLYRFNTFVQKTDTHLKCLASNCSYETEWDYYPSFETIKNHIESKHRTPSYLMKRPHPCVLCNILHKNRSEQRKHLKEKHEQLFTPGTPAVCECCLMITPSFAVKIHMFTHKNEEEQVAARSAKDVPQNGRLRKKRREPENARYPCPYENCGKVFKYSRSFWRHKQTHLPKEQRQDITSCPECNKTVLKESLVAHIKSFHRPELEDPDKLLTCTICGKIFKHSLSYQNHLRLHKGEKPFSCPHCPLSYSSKSSLSAHITGKHNNGQTIKCNFCEKDFSLRATYRRHLRSRHADKIPAYTPPKSINQKEVDSEFRYKCKFEGCDRAFKSSKSRNRHYHSHHGDERSDKTICSECGIVIGKEGMKLHMMRVHYPEMAQNLLVCEFCDKRFLSSDKSQFEAHIRRHKGEKPFLCTSCGSAFVSNTALNGHIKQVHTDHGQLSCEFCNNDKVWTKKTSLESHIRHHHPDEWSRKKKRLQSKSKFYYNEANEVKGEVYGPIQKFPCSLCDTLCSKRETLKRHMSRKHNEASTNKGPSGGNSYSQNVESSEEEDGEVDSKSLDYTSIMMGFQQN